MDAFDSLGDEFGVGGDFLATIFWLFVMLMVSGVAVVASGNSTVGVAMSIPMIFIGNYLGVIPLVITALLGVGSAAYLFHQLIQCQM